MTIDDIFKYSWLLVGLIVGIYLFFYKNWLISYNYEEDRLLSFLERLSLTLMSMIGWIYILLNYWIQKMEDKK